MIHIQKFIERVQGFDARAAKDFTMPMKDAKDLHSDITRLLISLQALREYSAPKDQEEVIQLEIGGGSFK